MDRSRGHQLVGRLTHILLAQIIALVLLLLLLLLLEHKIVYLAWRLSNYIKRDILSQIDGTCPLHQTESALNMTNQY